MNPGERMKRAMDVALGRRPADAVLRGAKVVDVHLTRVREGLTLGLSGDRIAYMGPEQGDLYGPDTRVRDLKGAYLLPGLIDGHTHLDSIFTVSSFAQKAVPFGNTTCLSETALVSSALGAPGLDLFCRSVEGQPLRVFFLASALTPPMPELESSIGLDEDAFDRFLARPEVKGMGESYWVQVVAADSRSLHRIPAVQAAAKSVEGHSAGAHDRKLMAYKAAGVESCHESTTTRELRTRMELGLAVQIREGYIRREMEAVVPGLTPLEQASPLIQLVSDVADPAELVGEGGLNLLLKKGVALGLDPIRAVQMMTLNPAAHFNLRLLGSIVPGKLADLVAVKDLKSFECLEVWVGGRQVSTGRDLIVETEPFDFPDWTLRSIDLGGVKPEDLVLRTRAKRVAAKVLTLVDETITVPEEIVLTPRDGKISADPAQDLILMAHLHRHGRTKPALGLIRGSGIREGAVAMSLTWDNCNVLVLGVNEHEMAFALNRVRELGGGLVAVRDQKVEAEMPLPVGGIASTLSLEEVVKGYRAAEEGVKRLGCGIKRPFLTLQIIPFTGLPYIRITDKGLVDIKEGRLVKVLEPLD